MVHAVTYPPAAADVGGRRRLEGRHHRRLLGPHPIPPLAEAEDAAGVLREVSSALRVIKEQKDEKKKKKEK